MDIYETAIWWPNICPIEPHGILSYPQKLLMNWFPPAPCHGASMMIFHTQTLNDYMTIQSCAKNGIPPFIPWGCDWRPHTLTMWFFIPGKCICVTCMCTLLPNASKPESGQILWYTIHPWSWTAKAPFKSDGWKTKSFPLGKSLYLIFQGKTCC